MILILQSTTFGAYGGIPTYNRLVCRVMNEFTNHGGTHVLIATDKGSDIQDPSIEFPRLRLQAFDHNRLGFVLGFTRLIVSRRCDLALLGHVNYAPLGWVLKRLRPQMRYGVMLYGVEAWRRLPWLKRRALQQADFLVSISQYTKQRAVEANALLAESIYLLPNALDSDSCETEPITLQRSAAVGITLLSVCRLEGSERYKGVDKVIEVLPALIRMVPRIQYLVVGGGTDLERHRQLAEKVGVSAHVQFLGFLSAQAMRECYRDCDVFVMPSAGEGFGFVFLEAMQYAKPVIAAKSGGAPEVVEDGVTGRLVEYGNHEELTRVLLDLCLNADKRRELGLAGYQRLQKKFTFSRFKQRLSEILLQELPPKAIKAEQIPVGQKIEAP